MNGLIQFFGELFTRLGKKNPAFFNVLQAIAIIAYGLFFASDKIFTLNMPDKYFQFGAAILGTIIAISNLPVKDNTILKK
jgi:hypothetical protein